MRCPHTLLYRIQLVEFVVVFTYKFLTRERHRKPAEKWRIDDGLYLRGRKIYGPPCTINLWLSNVHIYTVYVCTRISEQKQFCYSNFYNYAYLIFNEPLKSFCACKILILLQLYGPHTLTELMGVLYYIFIYPVLYIFYIFLYFIQFHSSSMFYSLILCMKNLKRHLCKKIFIFK